MKHSQFMVSIFLLPRFRAYCFFPFNVSLYVKHPKSIFRIHRIHERGQHTIIKSNDGCDHCKNKNHKGSTQDQHVSFASTLSQMSIKHVYFSSNLSQMNWKNSFGVHGGHGNIMWVGSSQYTRHYSGILQTILPKHRATYASEGT